MFGYVFPFLLSRYGCTSHFYLYLIFACPGSAKLKTVGLNTSTFADRHSQVRGCVNMSVATTCFKWVDLLETQFDKSWIELDTLLMQLEEDEDLSCLYTKSRRHASSLASCFSQLSHKATVVFQNNAKLEAELVHLREELSATKANIDQVNSEKLYLAKALQDTLSKNHKLQYQTNGSEQAETDNDDDGLKIILNNNSSNFYHLKDSESCSRLVAENERLRTEVIELESEMVGARLDNVYLDKVWIDKI